jgi:hypothetical protein
VIFGLSASSGPLTICAGHFFLRPGDIGSLHKMVVAVLSLIAFSRLMRQQICGIACAASNSLHVVAAWLLVSLLILLLFSRFRKTYAIAQNGGDSSGGLGI